MKQTMKRLTALLLVIAMCMSLLCSSAWAADVAEDPDATIVADEIPEEEAEETEEDEEAPENPETEETEEAPEETPESAEDEENPEAEPEEAEEETGASEGEESALETIVYINPIYRDMLDEDDLVQPDENSLLKTTTTTVYTSVSAAAAFVREQEVAREQTIGFSYKTTSSDYNTLVTNIFNTSVEHTGVPDEGDYLLYQWGGFSGTVSYSYSSGYYTYTFSLTMTYYSTAAQEKAVTTKVNSIISGLNLSSKSTYQKIKAIYDYICMNIVYDYDYAAKQSAGNYLPWTAYGGLINGTCVCQGYSEIFYRLALEAGIDSRCIPGDSINHIWNIVELGNYYYNLDATWDSNYYEAYGTMYYKFFLKCPANFTDHPRNSEFDSSSFHAAYPMASSDYVPGSMKISSCTITLSASSYTYDGTAKTPTVTVKDGSATLTKGVDYSVTYSNNINPGTATVTVTGINDYSGTVTKSFTIAPKAATLSSVENASSGVKVTWGSVTGANQYGVFRKSSSESTYTKLGTTTATSYTDKTASNGTTYTYKVKAYKDSIGGAYSGTKSILYLSQPTMSSISNTSTGITVTWSKNSSASGYYVYRKTGTTGSYSKVTTITANTTVTYADTSVSSGTRYAYAVVAYNGSYVSAQSGGIASIYLSRPTISSVSNTASGVKITWSEVSGAGGYYILLKNDDGTYSTVKTVTSGSTVSWTDTSATSGRRAYAVQAYSGSYKSVQSAGMATYYLTQPVISSVTCVSTGMTIKWGKVTGATGYYVLHKNADGTYSTIKTITSGGTVSYTDTSASAGKNAYAIIAYNGTYKSVQSAGVAGYYLAQPVISSVTCVSTGMTIKWGKVSGATGYYVLHKNADGTYSTIKTITSGSTVSYTDTNASAGKNAYAIIAYNGSYQSVQSAGVASYYLARPVISSVTDTSTGLQVKWGKVSGAAGYYVYRKIGSDGTYVKLATITSGSTLSYKDTTVDYGTKYAYAIVAYYSGYTSVQSAGVAGYHLAQPVISSVTSVSTGMTIKWGKVTGATGYYVLRKNADGTYSTIATISSGSTVSYTDTSAAVGKNAYAIKAYNGTCVSVQSAGVAGYYVP